MLSEERRLRQAARPQDPAAPMPRRSIVPGSGTTLISTALSRALGVDQVPPLFSDKRNVSYRKPPEAVGVTFWLRPHLISSASEATTSAYCVLAAREKGLESKNV